MAESPLALFFRVMSESQQKTFWEHLDDLRGSVVRCVAVVVVFAVVAFFFKDCMFSIILAPKYDDFVTYCFFNKLFAGAFSNFNVELINTGLAQQFLLHIKAAFSFGVMCASPYVIYVLFSFVSPALYAHERRRARGVVVGGYVMFVLGVLLCYFLVFPFTFQFLGTYQVSGEVDNLISIESYMDTLIMLCLMMGIVFELPVVAWILSKMGLIDASFLRKYRRHAIVAILIVAAVITPTADVFTLCLVSLPIYLLYEVSVLIVRR